jgi:asparagine synthase (glutamine-hydrolysing)
MGFGVPVGQWFRGPLRDFLRDALLSPRALDRGYFREPEVRRLVEEHLEGRADHSFQLWNLLMLELWHREFI